MDLNKIPIIYNFSLLNIFVKVEIKNKKVITKNKEIEENIKNKIYSETPDICFYALIDENSKFLDSYKFTNNQKFSVLFPVYTKQSNLRDFINFYKKEFTRNKISIFESDKFTIRDYYFKSEEECLKSVVLKSTNPKQKSFDHIFFHASDFDDIEKYGLLYVRSLYNVCGFYENHLSKKINVYEEKFNKEEVLAQIPNNILKNNIYHKHDVVLWNKYKTNYRSIKNSLFYTFNKFKKGVLVGIKNNKIVIFLPMSNYNFRNDYFTELYIDEEDKKLLEEHYKNIKNKTFNHKLDGKLKDNIKKFFIKHRQNYSEIELDRTKWLANGCFFRNLKTEGEKSVAIWRYFLEELCKERIIPDTLFILNLRDHPIVHKELKEPYETFLKNKPIDKRYVFDEYLPILSVCGSKNTVDIPVPTQDDITREHDYYFPNGCRPGQKTFFVDWNDKKNIALFRGSATGCFIDNRNIRIKAVEISKKHPDLLDIGLTSYNRKIKKEYGKPIYIIDSKQKSNFISDKEKATYKYILTLDGHVSAFRLGLDLSINSVVLLPNSQYNLWFSYLLKPYEHYVPIKEDLSDLVEIVKWCKNNDDKCKEITKNANNFYNKYLTKTGMLDYMQKLFTQIPFNNLELKKYDIKIAIILCYRNTKDNSRLLQKNKYLYIMNNILRGLCEYKILVVEQNYVNKFNIGKLKNIGFDYLTNKLNENFDNFIFSDIDMLPDSNLIDYYFKITDSMNILAWKGTRYNNYDKKHNKPFAGGVVSFTDKAFKKINGYPNNFYGWQGEDDNLLLRLQDLNMKIYKPKTGKVIDIEEDEQYNIKNLSTKMNELKKSDLKDNQAWEKNVFYKNYKENGLNSLYYEILEESKIDNNYHIVVDPLLDLSIEKNPEFYNFNEVKEKDYRNLIELLKSIKQEFF